MTDTVPLSPPPPLPRFGIAVTGHRQSHRCFAEGSDRLNQSLAGIFSAIDAHIASLCPTAATTRLFTLLADGTDQVAATLALAHGYALHCPLPFGQALNAAINSHPADADEAQAILAGGPARLPKTIASLAALQTLAAQAQLFELAEQDSRMARLFLDALAQPQDSAQAQLFRAEAAVRVAAAGQMLIEQADLLIAFWDGATSAPPGGTGYTVLRALTLGTPVLWIDPVNPDAWTIITTPEAMACHGICDEQSAELRLHSVIRLAMVVDPDGANAHGSGGGHRALEAERWRPRSRHLWHAYRRVEALFGAADWRSRFAPLTQVYETPNAIAAGSAAQVMEQMRALDQLPADFPGEIDRQILHRFAWADGISAYLSDCYRSGMTINFLLSALAISGGIVYLPLVAPNQKWLFALFELALLLLILLITAIGQKRHWHDRWFETRRVAEYLRHGPILLSLGVARPPGRWSGGASAAWPEHYARHALRSAGLPRLQVTQAFLRAALTGLLARHVVRQRDYHFAKADRLVAVHHNLDRSSQILFQAAVLSVSIYLTLAGLAALGMIERELVEHTSKLFTVLGVVLPTFGAAIAGIRYFGDFERFAAISKVAADKLDAIHRRITLLASSPDDSLTYAQVANLAHAADDVVVDEIESWQAVFAGKHVTVPV